MLILGSGSALTEGRTARYSEGRFRCAIGVVAHLLPQAANPVSLPLRRWAGRPPSIRRLLPTNQNGGVWTLPSTHATLLVPKCDPVQPCGPREGAIGIGPPVPGACAPSLCPDSASTR